MQSLKFIRTLSLARNNLLRAGRANGGSAKQLTKKVIIGTGATGTLLGLSFWGSSTPKEDENKFSALPPNVNRLRQRN
uniref:Ubiquinol-cytochrome-c reductase complex assembly factor 3 n=1 Tax=Rhabditophanes sp. KR3021 TaxID=114890 RepID=A0AC35TWD6_9BILA